MLVMKLLFNTCVQHLAIAWLLAMGTASLVEAQGSDEALALSELRDGKAVAIMRHALAPGTGDPPGFTLGQCDTQRNLSEEGREQARRIGKLFRSHGIGPVEVLSSEWCRCQETARLLDIGPVKSAPMLNSFFQDRSRAEPQTQQLNEALEQWLREQEGARLLVTHQVNISALTREFTGSGDILIITLTNGKIEVLYRIQG